MKGITAGTVARTVFLALALINQALLCMGYSVLPIDSEAVAEQLAGLITAVAALIAWWKNNSFTKEAQAADQTLARLRAEKGEKENGLSHTGSDEN